jgi:hypothetical protein
MWYRVVLKIEFVAKKNGSQLVANDLKQNDERNATRSSSSYNLKLGITCIPIVKGTAIDQVPDAIIRSK